jgi:hypothetical protein
MPAIVLMANRNKTVFTTLFCALALLFWAGVFVYAFGKLAQPQVTVGTEGFFVVVTVLCFSLLLLGYFAVQTLILVRHVDSLRAADDGVRAKLLFGGERVMPRNPRVVARLKVMSFEQTRTTRRYAIVVGGGLRGWMSIPEDLPGAELVGVRGSPI